MLGPRESSTSMSETVTRRFRVDEFVDNLVWVELEEGDKRGLQFALPVESDKYNSTLQNKIDELEEDEIITATLISENDRNTAWRFASIEHNNRSRELVPADD